MLWAHPRGSCDVLNSYGSGQQDRHFRTAPSQSANAYYITKGQAGTTYIERESEANASKLFGIMQHQQAKDPVPK